MLPFDFQGLYIAAKVLSEGGNPYDFVELQNDQLAKISAAGAPWPIFNPPWTFLFIAPFLRFSFETATVLWMVCSALVAAIASAELLSSLSPGGVRAVAGFLMIATFPPLFSHLETGQVTLIALGGLVLLLYAQERIGPTGAVLRGLALALLLIKPQLMLAILALQIVSMLRRRDYLEFITFCSACAVLLVFPEILWPKAWPGYLQIFPGPRFWRTFVAGAVLRELPDGWLPVLKVAGAGASVATGLWMGIYSRHVSVAMLCGAALPLSVLFSPHQHPYDMVCLLPAIVWVSSRSGVRATLVVTTLLLCQMILFSAVTTYDLAYVYAGWTCLTVLWVYRNENAGNLAQIGDDTTRNTTVL